MPTRREFFIASSAAAAGTAIAASPKLYKALETVTFLLI